MLDLLQSTADDLIRFVQLHHAWAIPIAFGFAFAKALAIVSLAVPTTLAVLVVSGLTGAAGLSVFPLWLAVSAGAFFGDWLSYAIGWRVKHRIHHHWPFATRPEMLARAEIFVRRWGMLSVVLCRFFSPLRATVPLLCGVFEMPFWRFQIANLASAMLWAAIVLVPGSLIGAWVK